MYIGLVVEIFIHQPNSGICWFIVQLNFEMKNILKRIMEKMTIAIAKLAVGIALK